MDTKELVKRLTSAGMWGKTVLVGIGNRVVMTWRSGRKGKCICVVGLLAILFALKSCISGCDSSGADGLLGAEYHFSENDFAKESETDGMFYVKDGKDDGYAEVVPNLRKIPKILREPQFLPRGFRPQNECNIGTVYYTNPDDAMRSGICTVVHVDDGWIVVRTDMTTMYGDYTGIIYTRKDEVYIEKQKVHAGFYVLVGTQKVALVNGSSQTMFAFVGIDESSNKLALEAVRYNEEAENVARKENDKRCQARKERAKKENEETCHRELAKALDGFSFRDIKSQFHFPREKIALLDEVKFIDSGSFSHNGHVIPEKEFLGAIASRDWAKIAPHLQRWSISEDTNPAEYIRDAYTQMQKFTRGFKMTQRGGQLKGCWFFIVDMHQDYPVSGVGYFQLERRVDLPIDADFYCVLGDDEKDFRSMTDGKTFKELWDKKYGE